MGFIAESIIAINFDLKRGGIDSNKPGDLINIITDPVTAHFDFPFKSRLYLIQWLNGTDTVLSSVSLWTSLQFQEKDQLYWRTTPESDCPKRQMLWGKYDFKRNKRTSFITLQKYNH